MPPLFLEACIVAMAIRALPPPISIMHESGQQVSHPTFWGRNCLETGERSVPSEGRKAQVDWDRKKRDVDVPSMPNFPSSQILFSSLNSSPPILRKCGGNMVGTYCYFKEDDHIYREGGGGGGGEGEEEEVCA